MDHQTIKLVKNIRSLKTPFYHDFLEQKLTFASLIPLKYN